MNHLARAALVFMCACGSIDVAPDASSGDASDDIANVMDAGGCFVCPQVLPAAGGACTSASDASSACEYGDFTTGDCSSLATCTDAGWSLAIPSMPQCSNASDCPSAFGADASCSGALRCDYAAGTCGCESAADGGLVWSCETTTDPLCPPVRPRIGSPCQGAHECDYGDENVCSPLRGLLIRCDACGTWQLMPVVVPPCPH